MASTTSLEATARWTAAVRAMETARDDRLFEDPWAAELAGREGHAWIEARTPDSVLPLVIRTRYYDDWLLAILGAPELRQVVLMGAGLDTRAYRLPWPDRCVVFELDRAAILEHKAAILERAGAAARCERRTVVADLREPWTLALEAAGFDAGRPAAWLLEGLLFYLPGDDVVRVLDTISVATTGSSRLGFDIVNAAVLTSPFTKPWVDMQAAAGAPWLGTIEDPVGFLAERGWAPSLTQAGQPDADYGRWTLPVVPTYVPDFPHYWFVTATRQG
jgi:methyltransferase (TIGR00027 family)